MISTATVLSYSAELPNQEPDMNVAPSLPLETWRVLHAILMDDAVPRRAAIQAIGAFERALNAAHQSSTPPEEPPE